jgi:hypothetical protein
MSYPDISKVHHTYIDFEASSLNEQDSYPISLGIVHQGQTYYWLIKPKSSWIDWDVYAERIHNISRSHLNFHGKESSIVAEEMKLLLGKKSLLYSDNPFWESLWLNKLGIGNIQVADAYGLIVPGNEEYVEPTLEAIRKEYSLTHHNALDDAITLALTINQLR